MRRRVVVLLLAAACLTGFSVSEHFRPAQAVDAEFVVAGSGSCLPIAGKLAAYYNLKFGENIEVPASIGSTGALKALEAGAIDLGLISRPLTEVEKKQGFKEIRFARVAIVLGTHPDVPDDGLTYQALVDIYQARKTVWGNGEMIIVYMRELEDSSNQVLSAAVPGFKGALTQSHRERRWQVCYSDQEEAEAIAATPYSLGLTDSGTLAVSGLKIKVLKVNGVAPSLENVKNGSYPLFKDCALVYKGALPSRVQGFVDFVLSKAGAKVITASGGIPLRGH